MKKIITLLSFCLCAFAMTAQGPALKVASSGNVGINNGSPIDLLHITDVGTSTPSFIVEATVSAGGATQNFVKAAAGTTASAFLYDQNNFFAIAPAADTDFNGDGTSAANSFNVFGASGQVTIGHWGPLAGSKLDVRGGTIAHEGTVVHSDKRLKSNVTDFSAGLDAIMNLETVKYTYNGKAGTTPGVQHIGIYAQDLRKVVPELVMEYTHTEYNDITSFADKRTVKSQEQVLAIRDNEVKYLLINAIQDQQTIIDEQAERIDRLEELVETLAATVGSTQTQTTLSNKAIAELAQNNPNPFNGTTQIDYAIPANAKSASINIFDLNGKMLKKVAITHQGKGSLEVSAQDLPSGTYTYNLIVDGEIIGVNKMVLQK